MSIPLNKAPRRILALWFPYLASDRVFRQRLGRSWRSALPTPNLPPLIFSRLEDNARRIVALNTQAERLRLKRGMGVADARAIHPSVEVLEADPASDRGLLESLADWCDRYTPLVALDGVDGLLLDITGCAHLFGGERSLLDDVSSRLLRQGFHCCAGLASTAGMAWAAARYLHGGIVPAGEEEDVLSPLPLAALRLDPGICASLESVGLRNVGAIAATARAPLVRRFGGAVTIRLDQALGRVEEAISPRQPAAALCVERHLAEPALSLEEIEALTDVLARSLVRELERRGEGARELRLTLFRIDGMVDRIDVHTSRPLRQARLIWRLFHEKLAALEGGVDMGFGFELVRLSASATDRVDPCQTDLGGDEGAGEADLAVFADRVRARLGNQAMLLAEPIESHIPERAVRLLPFAEAIRSRRDVPLVKERPIRLFAYPEPVDVGAAGVPDGPPVQFRWRRSLHVVARAEGPERIAPEWWLHPASEVGGEEGADIDRQGVEVRTARLTRDYFRIEDADGRRFWLYREGLYGPATHPRWFMHGLFA